MWGWDPSKGEGPAGGTTPTLLPTESTSSPAPPPAEPHPVVVPDVQGLKQQFQNQQNLLAQIKETLRENDADRTSKEKQLEMYANKLSQIKSRSKNAQRKTSDVPQSPPPKQLPRRLSKENLSGPLSRKPSTENVSSPEDCTKKPSTKGKMSELKKRLEENKLKFEEQTEKEMSETKRIESMVEQLKTQVNERNVTIHELQKTMDTPPTRPKVQTLPRRKERNMRCSQGTQTVRISEKTEADLKIMELEATIVDLEDTIKQQTSVIASRTQAVALLTQDLSKKSKTAVDDLEETRLEMRALQSNFVDIEAKLKRELLQKDNRLTELEEKIRNLESMNAQLSMDCATVEMQLSEAAEKCVEKETALKLLEENIQNEGSSSLAGDVKATNLEKKIEELTKELDASNKLMIRLKLEHKNKLKAANKSLELLKTSSNDSNKILQLSTRVDELEAEKVKLESKIAELEEEKVSEANLNQLVSDLKNTLKQKESEIMSFEQLVASYEAEKITWQQCIEDQNILVDNLNMRIQNLEDGAASFEPFEVPGDGASQHFDLSNKELQSQIEELIAEKQGLLEKLKNLPSMASTDSTSFEKVDLSEIQALSHAFTASPAATKSVDVLSSIEQSLLDEKQKSASYVAKIKELEECIESLEKSTDNVQSGSKGKSRLQRLERELFNTKKALDDEKERVKELCDKLEDKEKLIKEYIEKIEVFEKDEWSHDLSETQRKCLGLENSLLELTEHCERLRKENIEVVHQLSEEKVRHKRVEEEMVRVSAMVPALQSTAAALDERVRALEMNAENRDVQEALEYLNIVIAGKDTEIFNLQSSLADRGHEIDSLREEFDSVREKLSRADSDLAFFMSQTAQFDSQSRHKDEQLQILQGSIASQEKKMVDLEELCKKYADDLQKKSDECAKLVEERHRLQVSIETIMADNAIVSQARDVAEEKLSALERKLQEADSGWEQERSDWKHFVHATEDKLVRERNEALMKGEEAEKVLQKTWAERNDLIQSKQDLIIRYTEMEKALNNLQYEKNQAEAHSRELSKRLEEVGPAHDVIDGLKSELELRASELERKKEEYNNLALKAKKLAANLKKKAQVEKELMEQIHFLSSEKESEMAGARKESAEKWATEESEKQNLLKEKELIQSKNAELSREKDELLRQNEELVSEREMYIREAEAAFAEKCTMEEEYINYKQVCGVLEQQIASLTTERNQLTEKLEDLEKQWAIDKTELESLGKLYTSTQKSLETAQIRLNALEQTFELEEQENEALLHQKAALLQEQKSLQDQCREREERLSSIEKENADLVRDIQKLKQALESANQELANQQSAFNNDKEIIVQNCKDTQDRLNKTLKENENLKNQIRVRLQEAEASAENYKQEINRLLQQESYLLEEKENIENKLKKMEEEQKCKIEELQQKILMLQESSQLLQAETVDRLMQVNQNAALLQEIDQCKDTIVSLQSQLAERTNALNAEIVRSNQVNEDLMNLRSLAAEKDSEIQRLKESSVVAAAEAGQGSAKRKKSVTFKTDDGDYIRELRGEVTKLQEDLSEGKGKIAELEKELVREKKRTEAEEALVQVETPSPEETLSPSVFFQATGEDFFSKPAEINDPFSEESLAWDDGWGSEGHLEEAHALSKEASLGADPEKLFKLERELEALVNEKEKVDEDFRVLQVKYSKVIKKLKEQKVIIDRLQGEVKMAKSGMGGDLDAAIMDEMREEIKRVEARESEVRKELNAMKVEKETLLKRIDVLNAGNERFMEMKERQDSEVAVWQQKHAALLTEITNLQAQLKGPRPDDSEVARENSKLRNLMEGLEWKISELTELVEEKDEELSQLLSGENNGEANDLKKPTKEAQSALDAAQAQMKLLEQQLAEARHSQTYFDLANERIRQLELELEEARVSESAAQENLKDMEAQLSMLATENETLQEILNGQKLNSNKNAPDSEPLQILQYFNRSPVADFFEQSSATVLDQARVHREQEELEKECKELSYQLATKQQELLDILKERDLLKGVISELKNSLLMTEEEMQQLRATFENEKLMARQQTEEILETLAMKEAELDASSNYLDLLKQKEEEVVLLKNQLAEISSSTTVAMLNEESWLAHDQLRDKEDQVEFLTKQVQELQKAYSDSKSEIERLLNEERIRSETPLEDEFATLKRTIDFQKAELEAALRAKDNELFSLKECLTAAETEVEEARNKNELIIQQLKAQLRQLDLESVHLADEKDTEIAELRAEVKELQDLVATKALEIRCLRDEMTSLNKQFEEDVALLPTIKKLLEEREIEIKKLKEAIENFELVIVEKDAEIAELRLNIVSEADEALKMKELLQQLAEKEEEVRALKGTLESVHAEMSQFRNFDKQLRDMQLSHAGDVRAGSNLRGESSDWNTEETMELAGRLQSDLDTALYMLHQRDVRCEELTFELMQLLEERDTLQLRLSTVIRTYEELKSQVETGDKSTPGSTASGGSMQNLTDKISELHNVGYARDKNIQDESLQRHREQMALLNRDGRGKNRPVLDV